MRKTVLLFLGILVVSSVAAQSKVAVAGQIRHRGNYIDSNFNSTVATTFAEQRSRLNITFTPVKNVTAFVQIQDARVFGSETSTLTDGAADNLDLHQGYIRLANLFDTKFSLKLGRFEAIYGPQRLIGAVGWHNIGRSFDGQVINYTDDRINIDVFNFHTVETLNAGDEGDGNVRGAYATLNVLEGIYPDAFFIQDNELNTLGTYIKGSLASLSFELEYATQFGTNANDAEAAATMLGLNAGVKFGGMNVSAGLDLISGDDSSTVEVEAFNTLYATNHKYYGYMDYFVNLPRDTDGLGLKDFHVKAGLMKIMGIAPNIAYHIFSSDQKSSAGDSDFGSELDMTLKYGLNESVKFTAGYSIFMPGALMEKDGETATYMYLITTVNF